MNENEGISTELKKVSERLAALEAKVNQAYSFGEKLEGYEYEVRFKTLEELTAFLETSGPDFCRKAGEA